LLLTGPLRFPLSLLERRPLSPLVGEQLAAVQREAAQMVGQGA